MWRWRINRQKNESEMQTFLQLLQAWTTNNKANRCWHMTIFAKISAVVGFVMRVGTTHEGMHFVVFITVQKLVGIGVVVLKICEFQYYASLAWKCLFTPIFAFFGGTFPRNDVTHHLNPQKREYRLSSLSLALEREKRNNRKVTKGLYFIHLWRRPHWSNVNEKLFSQWCSRRNHECKVSKRNFQWLRFYRGSNFPFSYWYLNGPYNTAALLSCL